MKKKCHTQNTHTRIYIYTYNNIRAQCNNEQRKIMKEKRTEKNMNFYKWSVDDSGWWPL